MPKPALRRCVACVDVLTWGPMHVLTVAGGIDHGSTDHGDSGDDDDGHDDDDGGGGDGGGDDDDAPCRAGVNVGSFKALA